MNFRTGLSFLLSSSLLVASAAQAYPYYRDGGGQEEKTPEAPSPETLEFRKSVQSLTDQQVQDDLTTFVDNYRKMPLSEKVKLVTEMQQQLDPLAYKLKTELDKVNASQVVSPDLPEVVIPREIMLGGGVAMIGSVLLLPGAGILVGKAYNGSTNVVRNWMKLDRTAEMMKRFGASMDVIYARLVLLSFVGGAVAIVVGNVTNPDYLITPSDAKDLYTSVQETSGKLTSLKHKLAALDAATTEK